MEQKKVVIIGTSVGIAGVILVGAIALKGIFGTNLSVLPEVRVEVGEKVYLEPALFADATMKDSDIERVNISTKLTKDETKYKYNQGTKEVVSKGKKYLEAGTYEVTLKAGSREAKSKLIVEDTTGPVITERGSDHRTPVGTDNFDYTSMVDIEDFSDFDVDIVTNSVDLSREGSYPVIYNAKDEYGNTSTLEITLNVGEASYTVIKPGGSIYESLATEDNHVTSNNSTSSNSDYANDTYKSWRDKYKHDKLGEEVDEKDPYDYDNYDDDDDGDKDDKKNSSKDKSNFGTVKEKTFKSEEEGQKWIEENLLGKGNVQWTYTIDSKGKVNYKFTYN